MRPNDDAHFLYTFYNRVFKIKCCYVSQIEKVFSLLHLNHTHYEETEGGGGEGVEWRGEESPGVHVNVGNEETQT